VLVSVSLVVAGVVVISFVEVTVPFTVDVPLVVVVAPLVVVVVDVVAVPAAAVVDDSFVVVEVKLVVDVSVDSDGAVVTVVCSDDAVPVRFAVLDVSTGVVLVVIAVVDVGAAVLFVVDGADVEELDDTVPRNPVTPISNVHEITKLLTKRNTNNHFMAISYCIRC